MSVFACYEQTGAREQFTSHQKLHWIIRFDSFPLKWKVNKITHNFFKGVYIPFYHQSHLVCLECWYANGSQILSVLLWHVAKNTYITPGLLCLLLCMLFQKQSPVLHKKFKNLLKSINIHRNVENDLVSLNKNHRIPENT